MKKHLLQKNKRFRGLGFPVGFLPAGSRNSIADIKGVTVGHSTIIRGADVRTGVTVIDPGVADLFKKKIPGAIYVGNGYGKLTGITQVEELGTIEAPIVLTNTHAVGPVMRGIVDLVIKRTPGIKGLESVNAVVGEVNDGRLNAIHKDVVTKLDVLKAYASRSADFAIGSVGAGTGARAFSWKGGIGTASRVVLVEKKKYTLGTLVQTNYGGLLSILGVPIGKILGKDDFREVRAKQNKIPDGSCMIVLATDAPFSAPQLKRIAKRAFFGIIRTGSIASHTSGDYVIAFSTNRSTNKLSDSELNSFFLAVADATEEAVYDALFAAETMKGRGCNALEALPKEEVIALLKKYCHE